MLPRGTTILGEMHSDHIAHLEIPVPVGWESVPTPEFGSSEMNSVGESSTNKGSILLGPMDDTLAASAISDDSGAAIALAETIQTYLLKVDGVRDEERSVPVDNEVGKGRAYSYLVSPEDGNGEGGMIYVAVFGSGPERTWLAYVSRTPSQSPEPRWVDRIVHEVAPIDE